MTFEEKAEAILSYLTEIGSSAVREQNEKGVQLFLSSSSGLGFAVCFSATGSVDISTVLAAPGDLRGEGQKMMTSFLGRMNSQSVFLRCWLEPGGLVAAGARVFEAGDYEPRMVFEVLQAVDRQASGIQSGLRQLCEVLKEMGCVGHA